MLLLALTSFLAGVLTVLAPCILPILPVIVGGSVGKRNLKPALVLIGSLSISIVVFTLALRASTALIDIPQSTWTTVAGAIILIMGLIMLFPGAWEHLSLKFNNSSKHALQKAGQQHGWKREALMGVALGPVFTSCSPTYALILATVLPASYVQGVLYTSIYALGLASVLLLIAIAGHKVTSKLRGAADPNGWLKKGIAILLILVGLGIVLGWDKGIEVFIIEQGYFGVTELEENLVEQLKDAQ